MDSKLYFALVAMPGIVEVLFNQFIGEAMFRIRQNPVVVLALIANLCIVGCASSNRTATDSRVSASVEPVTPRLFMTPSPVFDMICQQTPFKIDPAVQIEYQKELYEKLDTFQSEWDKAAISIVPESETVAGRKFTRKEYSVALALCTWIPMGDPVFIVTPGGYLGKPRKRNGFDLPLSMTAFVSMTHHELLHSLVENFVVALLFGDAKVSPMYERYKYSPKPETQNVLIHLHLMALQKAVYQQLGNKALLDATNTLYEFIGNDY
ncbi:MAG: hypothetical protein AB7H97_20475, partial [Pseudobdellovibrionaceae bacterium]